MIGLLVQDEWIVGLLDTRRLTVVPMTNAVGYYRNVREEVHAYHVWGACSRFHY